MISLAGVIGAGLFVGSSGAITTAGPAVLVSFILAGAVVVLVMRMLGEMSTTRPSTGSFSTYADEALGRWGGLSVGWLYWWFWVLIIPIEAIAGAKIIHLWIDVPQWASALIIVGVLTLTNLVSVRNYGELEFWFALVKIVAIIGFIVVGILAITGVLPGTSIDATHNLFGAPSFMPNGPVPVIAGILTAVFMYMGTEVVTIAASESKNPRRNVQRAVNSVIWRIAVFYLGSLLVAVAVVPWNSPGLSTDGTFQYVLGQLHIPGLRLMIEVVILTAVCSCANSAIYTSSRMLFSLAERGDAPRLLGDTTGRGVPTNAILASSVVGLVAVVVNYSLPEQLFQYLIATTGAIGLIVYLVIAVTHLRFRRALDAHGERAPVRMWLFPWLTYLTIGFIGFTLILMVIDPTHRSELILTLALTVVTVIVGTVVQRRGSRSPDGLDMSR
ncbi:MAG: amino acid permease [Mycobacterium sp.]